VRSARKRGNLSHLSVTRSHYLLLLPIGLGIGLWQFGVSLAWIWPLAFLPSLLRHVHYLIRLTLIIRRQRRLTPPFPHGLWGEVYRSIARHQQRGRKSRKRRIRLTRRFREAANAVPDALVILDKQHRVDWVHPSAATLMDIHWPEHHGRRIADTLTNPGLDGFIDAGEHMRPLDIAPKHNPAIMLSLRITPFGARKKQRLVVRRDITEIHHLNMTYRDFIANASHELRTALAVIAGPGAADPSTTHRAVLPRRSSPLARIRRDRAGAGHRQTRTESVRGKPVDRQ
jgi:two-component system, OmpR family, phosphate regulon sensor histidine kinase PhoR